MQGGELPRPFPWWVGWKFQDLHVPGMCREPRPCSMGSYSPIAQVKKPRLCEWPKLHCMASGGGEWQGGCLCPRGPSQSLHRPPTKPF